MQFNFVYAEIERVALLYILWYNSFQLVDIEAYGGNSDGGILDASVIGKNLRSIKFAKK